MLSPCIASSSCPIQTSDELTIEYGVAHLKGKCETIPFRNAPGFVSLHGGQHWSWDRNEAKEQAKNAFPDLSRCEGLKLVLKTNVPYAGYHVDIGMPGRHTHGWGYKSTALAAPTEDFGEIALPFSGFSLNSRHHRQGAQGENGTAVVEDITCSNTNPDACPDIQTLCNMRSLSIIGDGVLGDIDLEVKSIRAFGCDADREAGGTCLTEEGEEGGAPSDANSRAAEPQGGRWKRDVLWFVLGSAATLAAVAILLAKGGARRAACSWSWTAAAPASEEAPAELVIPVSELA